MREIPTSSFTVKSDFNGSSQQLIFEPVSGMSIITYQLEMIEQHALSGFIKPLLRQKNNQVQIKFDLSDYIPLDQWIQSTSFEEKQLLGCLDDLLKIIKISESYMLNPTSIIANIEHMYIHTRTQRLSVLYLPIDSQGLIVQDIQLLIKELFNRMNALLLKHQVVQRLGQLLEKQGLCIEDLRAFIEKERAIYHFGEPEKHEETDNRKEAVQRIVPSDVESETKQESSQSRKMPNPIQKNPNGVTKKATEAKMPIRPIGTSAEKKQKQQTNKKDKTGIEMAFFSIIFQVIVFALFLMLLPLMKDLKMLIGLLSVLVMLDIFIEMQIFKFVKNRNQQLTDGDGQEKSNKITNKVPKRQGLQAVPISRKGQDNVKLQASKKSNFGFVKKPPIDYESQQSEGSYLKSASSISNAFHEEQTPLSQTCFIQEDRIVGKEQPSKTSDNHQDPLISSNPQTVKVDDYIREDEKTVFLDDQKTEFLDNKRAFLLFHYNNQSRRYGILKDKFLIGRLENQADLHLESKHVGRKHAEIHRRGQLYYLLDLNSKNKTFVNGVYIEPNAEVLLNDGDLIKIADCQMTFSIEA